MHAVGNRDRGGNDVPIDLGEPRLSNLHGVWDFAIVARRNLTPEAYAEMLLARHRREPVAAGPLDPVAWTNESHALAVEYGYRYPGFTVGSPPKAPVVLDDRYWERAAPVVDARLLQAGVRLAALLNAAFAD
jgi:hypothetical protein